MNPSLIIFILAIIVVGVLIFVAILASQTHRQARLDKENYQADWLAIENSLAKDNPASYQVAIIDADKLLDKALKDLGFSGKTMGDRLKKAASNFPDRSTLNATWAAHKLRNQLAHESGATASYDQTKRALLSFKKALQELGAI